MSRNGKTGYELFMQTPKQPGGHGVGSIWWRALVHQSAAAALLSIGTATASAGEPGKPPISEQTMRSGGLIDPEQAKLTLDKVDLSIAVDPKRETLSGIATLNLTAKAALNRLVLDLDPNIAASAIAINGTPLATTAWTNPEGRMTITLPSPIAAGQHFVAMITYGGTPHVAVRAPWDDGIVWSQTPDGKPWVATTAQGYGCDLIWPCIDHPAGEPQAAAIHITVPRGLQAISNGVSQGAVNLPDGRTRWDWLSGPINPYLIAINIGPYREYDGSYKSRFGNTIPLNYWGLPGHDMQARALVAEFAPTLDFFETLIGPFPFGDQKFGIVEAPYLGMEHQTMNGYGNRYKQAPEGFDWLFQHELSHEWFGNQMTAANWDDFWLHEGFGEYMQPLYGRWREGEARYAAMMAEQRLHILNKQPIVSGEVRTSEQVYEDDQGGPGGDIYYKGAWVLHSLRNLIGDKAFFAATTRLVYERPDPKPGNFKPRFGSTAEFERLASEEAGRDLSWFFDVYLRRAALPDLIEAREGDRLNLSWKTPDDLPFPMPVEVQVGDRAETVAMAGNRGSIAVAAGAHVVVDPWARILRRSEAIERVQAQDRAGEGS